MGLKTTTATVACALSNTLPALTFVMAAVLKMETVRLRTYSGFAKVFGTAVCVGGSMVMPFYHGPLLKVWASPLHWRYAEHATNTAAPTTGSAAVVGDVLIILSCAAWAIWFIIQVSFLVVLNQRQVISAGGREYIRSMMTMFEFVFL